MSSVDTEQKPTGLGVDGQVTKEVIEGLRRVCAACVGDVLTGQGLNCVVEGVYPIDPSMKVCGPAVTLRHIASRDKKNWTRHAKLLKETCKPGDVLVVDMGGRTDGASWGDNIAIDARNRGLEGAVIDGGCRQTEAIREIGFPTFIRGKTLRHTHGTFYSTNLNNEPVQIGAAPFSVMVAPGDVIVGDADGLVVVPKETAAETLKLAEERHEIHKEARRVRLAGKGVGDAEVDALTVRSRRAEGVEQADGYRH